MDDLELFDLPPDPPLVSIARRIGQTITPDNWQALTPVWNHLYSLVTSPDSWPHLTEDQRAEVLRAYAKVRECGMPPSLLQRPDAAS